MTGDDHSNESWWDWDADSGAPSPAGDEHPDDVLIATPEAVQTPVAPPAAAPPPAVLTPTVRAGQAQPSHPDGTDDLGTETPTQVVASSALRESPAEPLPTTLPSDQTKRSRRSPWLTMLASFLVVTLLAGGGYAWYRQNQAAEAQAQALSQAQTALQTTLDALGTASTTADVRGVAQQAREAANLIPITAEGDPGIAANKKALDSIAAMESLSGDSLESWPALRAEALPAIEATSTTERPVDPEPALGAVDAVVLKGQATLKEWQDKVTYIETAASARLDAGTNYSNAAGGLIDNYTRLRDQTNDWLTSAGVVGNSVTGGGFYRSEALDFFKPQYAARVSVRDRLAEITPPEELKPLHNQVLTSVTNGAAGLQALLEGLEDMSGSTCTRSSCSLFRTSGYTRFQQITTNNAGYENLAKAWRDQVQSYIDEASKVPDLPAKPEV